MTWTVCPVESRLRPMGMSTSMESTSWVSVPLAPELLSTWVKLPDKSNTSSLSPASAPMVAPWV